VSSSPTCVRLEAQLASLNSGGANAQLADQIKRDEDAIARQQADIDRATEHARRVGCASQGLFSLFSGFSPQCGPLNSQIDEMRSKLDRMMSEVEQLKSGNNDQQSQRNVLVGQLAQNNCGAQYTAAARAAGPQGFFEALLGGGTIVNPGGNGGPAGTYRTVCVRTCDGFYFPISYSTVPSRFAADAQACQRLCPAAQASLYTYHNPGEQIEQAVSADGNAPYTALPNAFRYRKEVVSGCSCRAAGQTWAQALHNADDSSTLESGDIVVTDQNEKALTRIPGTPKSNGAAKPAATPAPANSGAGNKTETDPKNRKVRVVGPPFLSQQ
jgi:TolA-binding protein